MLNKNKTNRITSTEVYILKFLDIRTSLFLWMLKFLDYLYLIKNNQYLKVNYNFYMILEKFKSSHHNKNALRFF